MKGLAVSLGRYWHTVRHLEPVQVYGRLWFHAIIPRLDRSPAPRTRPIPGRWVPPIVRPQRMFGPTTLRFLNVQGECPDAAAWNASATDRLWLYNLHYFDDLNAAGAEARQRWHVDLIGRWIRENPPMAGTGWEPYPVSLRLVNWIKWAWGSHAKPSGFDESLALQARWLSKRVEHHLLGNHLLANAKALFFAGLYFEGPEADEWARRALAILARQLDAQVLADGAHIERSPMYHNIVAEDVVDLVNAARAVPAAGDFPVATWHDTASRMLAWAASMSHPDGDIAFFNDAACGVAPTAAALTEYAGRCGISASGGGTSPSMSGYARLEEGDAVVLVDVALVGPDNQPGHAHADTLSYELSLGRQRVLVNSGTSTYAAGAQRDFERSTAAHNTVEMHGEDSSEVWGAFRVARRARPFDVTLARTRTELALEGSHDGYHRLAGRPSHRRRWTLEAGRLLVTDKLDGGFRPAVARHYLHPAVRVTEDALVLGDGRQCAWQATGGRVSLCPATWHPEFGMSTPTTCIEVAIDAPRFSFELTW